MWYPRDCVVVDKALHKPTYLDFCDNSPLQIYLLTKDERFTLIVCDFASTDVNVTQVLLESRLKP